ncbi:MAG: hypothetical protein KKE23_00070 [Nanoarchaeota archaeon]|nr:hypothetical protein [Nanoarchaeota archaeon]
MDKKRLIFVQKRLVEDIRKGTRKRDFSPFDIYQFIDQDEKEAFLEEQDNEVKTSAQDVMGLLLSAKKEIIIFAGNLSWINISRAGIKLIDVLGEMANKGVKISILCGIHLPAVENIEKIIALNKKLKNKIEIRHSFQPLRAIIIDDKVARLKEIKSPSDYENLKYKKTFIFYTIYDPIWVKWLKIVFHNYFDSGDYAEARIRELKSIQKIK